MKEHERWKRLGDEVRLKILELLLEQERCACELLRFLHIRQSTLSHHMKALCEAGFVQCRKEGKWSHYSLNKEAFFYLQNWLEPYLKATTRPSTAKEC